MVVPLGPAMLDYTISEDEARFLLSKFPMALLVRWTDGFNPTETIQVQKITLRKAGMLLYALSLKTLSNFL
jgi:hypothetical protein